MRSEAERLVAEVLADLVHLLCAKDWAEAKSCNDAGEPGVALEVVCDQLYEHEQRISRASFNKIEAAGLAMNLDPGKWQFLRELVVLD